MQRAIVDNHSCFDRAKPLRRLWSGNFFNLVLQHTQAFDNFTPSLANDRLRFGEAQKFLSDDRPARFVKNFAPHWPEKEGESVIDWEQVATLQTAVGRDDFSTIMCVFFKEVEEANAQLTMGVTTDQFRDILHFVKGSALSVGFVELSEQCAQAEGNFAGSHQITSIWKEILTSYEESKEHFLSNTETCSAPIEQIEPRFRHS
ncbi:MULTISPECIES: Hpt domain-containing protein [Sulfitobacter]|uniref:Hpt domain-containing protein n=1 Tax=Sulfitobacter TaxID=60136 RepID=UPI00257F9C28|nr:Hpt domain-containing protein [Sulfitobacter sp. UBA1132]